MTIGGDKMYVVGGNTNRCAFYSLSTSRFFYRKYMEMAIKRSHKFQDEASYTRDTKT